MSLLSEKKGLYVKVLSLILLLAAPIVFLHHPALPPEAKASPTIVYSDPNYDGHIYDTGIVYADHLTMDVEDAVTNHYARGFVKFSLSGISGTLSFARLHLYVMASCLDDAYGSTSPLANPGLGECRVLHVDDYGSLDSGDFSAPSIGNDPGVLVGDVETPEVGYVSIDVTAAMQDDIDHGRSYTAFMIKLSTDTDGDGKRDGWYFGTAEQSGTGMDPYIEYALASPLSWTQVNADGFGDPNNKWVEDWIEFNGYVYLGMDNEATGIEVWRTSDGATWAQVGGDGFGDPHNVGFMDFEEFQSELYASVYTDGEVARIFKSSDGVSWHQVGSDGLGDSNNRWFFLRSFGSYLIAFSFNPATGTEIWTWDGSSWTQRMGDGMDGDSNNLFSFSLGEFDGYLYISTYNPTSGVEVWRSSDGETWSQANSDGFDGDANNRYVSDMETFNAHIYAVTRNDNGFELWRSSDGTSWSKVGDDGFGDPDNYMGRLIIFKEKLYLITYNAGPDTGVEVWRSSDGTSWSQTNEDGFGDPNNMRGYPIVGGDYLYVITQNDVTGVKVFRSSDGASWSQVNENGFGDINNKWGYVRFIFNNHLYVATVNEATGVEVWRLDEPVLQPDFQVTASPDSLTVSQGGSQTSTITVTSINGFSSPVELSYSWLGSAPTGVAVDLPGPVTPPADGVATSALTVSASSTAPEGSFTLRVTGASGSLTHFVDVQITITSAAPPDFSLSPSASSVVATRGSSKTVTITVTSMGSFSSPVTLSVSGAPTGVTTSFSTNPVTPPAGGTATSILTINVGATAPSGSYSLTVSGVDGGLTRTTTVNLVVSGCLIATAAYGSELSPEIQFLRRFRDEEVVATFAGSSFIKAFNAWYYSFSPTIAEFIAAHEHIKAAVKTTLYPLIGILRASSLAFAAASFNPEFAALTAGLLASGLIGLVYLSPPLTLLLLKLKRGRRGLALCQKSLLAALISGLTLLWLAETLTLPLMAMASTCLIVLSSMALSAVALASRLLGARKPNGSP